MKTTVKTMDYEKVMALPKPKRKAPRRINLFWRLLIQVLCFFGLMGTKFEYEMDLEGIDKDEPCLILMNHTCFLDMEIVHKMLFPRVFNIVASNDGFIVNGDFEVGKTTGWSVHQSTVVSAEAANGSMYGINLIGNGGWGGMLNQSFKTTKGLKYVLTLDVKVNNYGVNMQVRNVADDANLASKWFSLAQNGEWATYTFEFTAVSTDTYLNFCGGGGGSSTGGENVYVDNIKIVEIPCEHVYDSIQDDECNTCGHIRPVDIVDIIEGGQTSVSEDVNGLAFKFEIAATGASTDNNNKYVSGSASVNPYGNSNAYTLVAMGAVITNKADKATEALLNLNTINGKSIIKIEANYLLDSEDGSVAFATRIINIPDEGKDTTIYARCYYVFEKDGEQIVIYDDIVSKSYNG